MTFEVLREFEAETPSGILTLKEGQKVRLSKEEAIPLIGEGKIKPVERVAYKVYSEILQAYLWVVETDQDMHSLRSQGMTEAIYTGHEIQEIKKLSKEDRPAIHRVKETFPGGNIEEIKRNHEGKE